MTAGYWLLMRGSSWMNSPFYTWPRPGGFAFLTPAAWLGFLRIRGRLKVYSLCCLMALQPGISSILHQTNNDCFWHNLMSCGTGNALDLGTLGSTPRVQCSCSGERLELQFRIWHMSEIVWWQKAPEKAPEIKEGPERYPMRRALSLYEADPGFNTWHSK